jgi:hypothetical protein
VLFALVLGFVWIEYGFWPAFWSSVAGILASSGMLAEHREQGLDNWRVFQRTRDEESTKGPDSI